MSLSGSVLGQGRQRDEPRPITRGAARLGAAAILGVLLLLCCGRAEAASFDCGKAVGRVERLICEDPILSALDSQVEGAYRGALDRSNNPTRVKDLQKAWLKQRDACADAACMSAAYSQQIGVLSGMSDDPPSCGQSLPDDEVTACAQAYSVRADNALDRYLAAARKRLQGDGASKDVLREFDAAQAAWVAYREAECSAVQSWWDDGTVRFAKREACWQLVTEARTRTVWVTWLGYEDNTPPLLPEPTKWKDLKGADRVSEAADPPAATVSVPEAVREATYSQGYADRSTVDFDELSAFLPDRWGDFVLPW